jgi:hypothetical protein
MLIRVIGRFTGFGFLEVGWSWVCQRTWKKILCETQPDTHKNPLLTQDSLWQTQQSKKKKVNLQIWIGSSRVCSFVCFGFQKVTCQSCQIWFRQFWNFRLNELGIVKRHTSKYLRLKKWCIAQWTVLPLAVWGPFLHEVISILWAPFHKDMTQRWLVNRSATCGRKSVNGVESNFPVRVLVLTWMCFLSCK